MNQKIIVAVLALAAIAGMGYFLLAPDKNTSVNSVAQTHEFTLRVADNKLVEGPETLTVNQGDTVVIHITSDVDEELHVHGYDKSVDLEAGKETTLTLVADASGRFEYELEHSKTEIGSLEVLP